MNVCSHISYSFQFLCYTNTKYYVDVITGSLLYLLVDKYVKRYFCKGNLEQTDHFDNQQILLSLKIYSNMSIFVFLQQIEIFSWKVILKIDLREWYVVLWLFTLNWCDIYIGNPVHCHLFAILDFVSICNICWVLVWWIVSQKRMEMKCNEFLNLKPKGK